MNDLPVAVRRTPRRPVVRTALDASTPPQDPTHQSPASKKPITSRQRKRTRSSLSGSTPLARNNELLTPPSSGCQRSTQRAIPPTKRMKNTAKTPDQSRNHHSVDTSYYDAYGTAAGSDEVHIFPLRAILDDRVKRRIRRNGLSEEMNIIYNERKQRARKNIEEMTQLRKQLAAKEIENEMLREQSSLLQDTSRMQELEKEIAALRQGMHSNDLHNDDWDMAAGDGFSDDSSLVDSGDHLFRDDTTVEVEDVSYLASAKPYTDALSTFTPPRTSPPKSATPESMQTSLILTHSDVGVQVDLAGGNKASLETELKTLRCELVNLQEALEGQKQLELHLKAKASSAERNKVSVDIDPDQQLQMDIMIQTLADTKSALAALSADLSSLGPPGSEPGSVLSTLKEAFQVARQELQDLCLSDQLLPMTSHGTEIVKQMLQCLKDSAVQMEKYEVSLADHRTREEQLRRQLNDRVEAMGTMSDELRQKDYRIFKLETDKEWSEAIADGYRKSLVNARRSIVQKDVELAGMEENLKSMISVAADLQAQIAQVHVDREIDMAAKEAKYNNKVALKDLEVLELHKDIKTLKEALTQAHDSISRLQADNGRLQSDADRDKKAAKDTMMSLRTQLLQSLKMSEAFLA
ncbi:unnamed protein product [Discula destructiva]